MSYYVYILYSPSSKSFYKGQTNDLIQRLKRHNERRETYTSPGKPWNIVWYCIKPNIILEKKLKNLSKERLKLFINKYPSQNDLTGLDVFDPQDQ